MTSRTARGSAAVAIHAMPESAGSTVQHLRRDLQHREREFSRARARAARVETAAAQALHLPDLAHVEAQANAVAAAYRQLATAAWELARARAALP